MKLTYNLTLLFCALACLANAQKDLSINFYFVEPYSCNDLLTTRATVRNIGTDTIPNFTMNVENEDGELFSKNVTTPLLPGEVRIETLDIVPNKMFTSRYNLSIEVEGDVDLSNNVFSEVWSKNLTGRNLRLRIQQEAYNNPRFEINLQSGENLITSEFWMFQSDGEYKYVDLCVPEDTCIDFSIFTPFKSDWCSELFKANYSLNSDPSHIYNPGDTVYSIVYIGAFFTGPILYTVNNSYSVSEIQSGPIEFTGLTCDKPADQEARVSLIDLYDNSEILGFDYEPSRSNYSDEFCLESLPTSNSEISENQATIIFPNPSNGIFKIQSDSPITNLEIIDQFGRLVSEYYSLSNNQIDLSNQAAGPYFISYNSNGIRHTQKIVLK